MLKISIAVAVAAYVAAIFTWPWLRTKFQSVENEILDARQRLKDLEAKLKAKL